MFLFDPTFGASWENCEGEIRRIMDRAQAEIVFCKLWDDRRLAYRIKGRKRGIYVLVYFKAPAEKMAGLERDAQLSEHILRVLLLKADGLTPEAMEKMFTQTSGERGEGERREHEGGDDRGERGDRGGDRGERRFRPDRRPREAEPAEVSGVE
jgi:small subunit ribosomal protein S6